MKLRTLFAAALLAPRIFVAQPAAAQDITLEFVVWNYSLDTIQDNVKQVRGGKSRHQGQRHRLHLAGLSRQPGAALPRRHADRRHLCRAGLAAGLGARPDSSRRSIDIAPADALDDLKTDIAGFSLSDMTYKGKLYGLPYYADTISFIYNKKILEDAGIAVPTTWEEVTAAAEKLKAGGMEHPIVYEFDQELPNFFDAFVAQVYGRGGDLFDADRRRSSTIPNNAAYKQLEWLADAFKKDLVQQETHESKIIPSMNTGKHAFTIVFNYVLAAHEQRRRAAAAGQFALAPMPGEAHATLGFTKFYVDHRPGGGRPGARRSGLEVRELHGRQALQGRQALGGREGPGLRPALALRGSGRAATPGTNGSTCKALSSRWRPPRPARGRNGPPSGRPISGRCSPRRWSARRASTR